MLATELTPEEAGDRARASAAAIALAGTAFEKHGGTCCWFWRDDPDLTTHGAIRELTRSLRENGDRETWLAAREIERCL